MKTKQVTKLLAVMALAASPAAADPAPLANRAAAQSTPAALPTRTAARPAAPDPWASTAIVRIPSASAAPVAPLTLTALIELVSRPRTMPSGAPACGNVASRAPQPVDCGRSKP